MQKLAEFLDKVSRRTHLGWAFTPPCAAFIEHTTRCNLRCKTCARSYWEGEFQDMDPAVVQRVRHQVMPLVRHLTLSGYGEPLLSPWFFELFDHAVDMQKSISFITNGLLLDTATLRHVFQPHVDLHLSIDGATNDTMRYIRGASFDMALERLQAMRRMKEENPQTPFHNTVIFVALACNIAELPRLIEILAEQKVDRLIAQAPTFGNRPDEITKSNLIHHKELARHWLPIARQTAQRLGLDAIFPEYRWMQKPTDSPPSPPAPAPIAKCMQPWRELFIDVSGNVKACCFGLAEPLGNLREHNMNRIWNGPAFRHLRRTVNTNHPPTYCRRCGLWVGRNAGNEIQDTASPSAF